MATRETHFWCGFWASSFIISIEILQGNYKRRTNFSSMFCMKCKSIFLCECLSLLAPHFLFQVNFQNPIYFVDFCTFAEPKLNCEKCPENNGLCIYCRNGVAIAKPLHSVAICLYLTKSKRRNNDEIIYKFNRGYEFTSHFTMCIQSAPDDIQCSMAMQQNSMKFFFLARRRRLERVNTMAKKKTSKIDVLAGMITVLNVVCQ